MKLNENLLHGDVKKIFYRYLAPSMSATIMISANYFVDTLCIGRELGQAGIAALNLAYPVPTVFYALGYLMGAGGGARYAAYMAQGRKEQAKGVYTGALVTVLALSAILTALAVIFIDPLVSLLGGAGELRQGTKDYVLGVVIFTVAYIGECFYTMILRNDNAPRLSMMCTLFGCVSNIIMDVLFIWVFKWGMFGAALATSLGVVLNMAVGVCGSFRKESGLRIKFSAVRLREIFYTARVGMSTFLTEVDNAIVTFVYNMVLIRISAGDSTTFVAIYGIVVNVNTIVLAALNGISNAMQPLISANYGAGLQSRIKKIYGTAVRFGLSFSIVLVALIEWQAEFVVGIFLEPGEGFLTQAALAVRVVGLSYILASVNMLTVTFFQARQSYVAASCGSILRTLACPVLFVIAGAALFGINGVWGASLAIEGVTIVVLAVMYKKFAFKDNGMAGKEQVYG